MKHGGYIQRYTPLTSKGGGLKRSPLKRGKSPVKRNFGPSRGIGAKRRPTATKLKKTLWELCKQITRKIHGYNCYTCGQNCEAPHTGHFIPSSVCSGALRYDIRHLRPQCYRCNIHLSGNWPAFEKNLIRDKGADFVTLLKSDNEKTKGLKYDELWLQNQIEVYEELLKTL